MSDDNIVLRCIIDEMKQQEIIWSSYGSVTLDIKAEGMAWARGIVEKYLKDIKAKDVSLE